MFRYILANPFFTVMVIDVIVTLSVDASRDLLDLSINGVTWTHLLNFPIWIVALVFVTFAAFRGILDSDKLNMSMQYFRNARARHPVDQINEMRRLRRERRNVRIMTSDQMFGNLSPTRGITSATPSSAGAANARFV